METVSIVFFTNNRFAMLLGVALCSLFENKKGSYPIDIYVIDSGISPKNKKRLSKLEQKYQFSIHYVSLGESFESEIPFPKLSTHYYQPIESYHRLAIDRFLPPFCHRVIDMDVDVIFRGDVSHLFNFDLEGKTVGAVAEHYPSKSAKKKHLRDLCESLNLPLPVDSFYFNAGVLLIDLDRWRENKIERAVLELIRNHPEKLKIHDQDALNAVLVGDTKELPSKFNYLTAQIGKSDFNEPSPLVVHFAGGDKPWYLLSALPYQNEYIHYARQTSWRHLRYRKFMDVYFAKKYHLYSVVWPLWVFFKRIRSFYNSIFKAT